MPDDFTRQWRASGWERVKQFRLLLSRLNTTDLFCFVDYNVHFFFFLQGPLSVFNSKIKFNTPKQVTLNRDVQDGFGISIRGYAPTIICKISSRREVCTVQFIFYLENNKNERKKNYEKTDRNSQSPPMSSCDCRLINRKPTKRTPCHIL